jgi:hypothetical protein
MSPKYQRTTATVIETRSESAMRQLPNQFGILFCYLCFPSLHHFSVAPLPGKSEKQLVRYTIIATTLHAIHPLRNYPALICYC